MPLILGIESTCDETGAAVVRDGRYILSNVVASSADIHQNYGGVFPELACRRHLEVIIPVIDEAIQQAGVIAQEIDAIAVAQGPGLVGALLIGMQAAKGLSLAWNKPFVGVNHVEAHLFAGMMQVETPLFPALGVVLSGGHTLLMKILDISTYEPIATTVDDAVGEAFDKVASLLGLPYPGGPQIEQLARHGDPKRYRFKAGVVKKTPFSFSLSGLKTNVFYTLRGHILGSQEKADVAASFQETVFRDVAKKIRLAMDRFTPQAIYFGGGVCNNLRLREVLQEEVGFEVPLVWPAPALTLDNAAMIAGLGFHQYKKNPPSALYDLETYTKMDLTRVSDNKGMSIS